METEIWENIKDYPMYYVSNMGRVKRIYKNNKEKILKPYHQKRYDKSRKGKMGYYIVGLSNKGIVKDFLVHRLVLSAFSINNEIIKTV